jgi:hypothetical protein
VCWPYFRRLLCYSIILRRTTFGVARLLNDGSGLSLQNLRIHDLKNAGNSGAHEANARIQLGSYCSRADRLGDPNRVVITTWLAFEKSLGLTF